MSRNRETVTSGADTTPPAGFPPTDLGEDEAGGGIARSISRHVRTADTSWVVAGSLVGGLCAYLFQVVGSRALGEDAFAPIGVLWTIQYLVLSIPMLSLEAWVTREVAADHDVGRGLRAAALVMGTLAAAVAAIGVAFADTLFGGLTDLGFVAGLLVVAFGGFVVARGHAAGRERFRSYGVATGGESALRLLLLVAVLAAVGTTSSVAWVLPVGPALVGLWWLVDRRRASSDPGPAGGRPATEAATGPLGERIESRSGGFLAATTVANAAAQILLAGGPLLLVALGAGPAEVSVFFVTITAARTPLVFAIGGVLSRLLPPLQRVVGRGDRTALRRLAALAVAATVVGAAVAAAAAAAIGPDVVALFFGQGFRPGRLFVTLTAAASVLATGNLALNQVVIALRDEQHLPLPWVSGLVVAVTLALTLDGSLTDRTIIGLLGGELVALAGLVATVGWRSSTRHLAAPPPGPSPVDPS